MVGAKYHIVLEKNVIEQGEPIVLFNRSLSEFIVNLHIYVVSRLTRRSAIFYGSFETVTSHLETYRLRGLGTLKIKPQIPYPPTIASRDFLVRWNLTVGKPRLGGRILFPKVKIPIKVVPKVETYTYHDDITIEPYPIKPGVKVRIGVRGVYRDLHAVLRVCEWLRDSKGVREDKYILATSTSEPVVVEDMTYVEMQIPRMRESKGAPFYLYPLTFEFKGKDVSFGIKAELEVVLGKSGESLKVPVQITVHGETSYV